MRHPCKTMTCGLSVLALCVSDCERLEPWSLIEPTSPIAYLHCDSAEKIMTFDGRLAFLLATLVVAVGMLFGFSIGDILAVSKLANGIWG